MNVEIRIHFVAASDIEFPMHSRQSGSNESIVNLLIDRPRGGIDCFEFISEAGEIVATSRYGSLRPIGNPASRTFHARNIVVRDRHMLRAPCPESPGQS